MSFRELASLLVLLHFSVDFYNAMQCENACVLQLLQRPSARQRLTIGRKRYLTGKSEWKNADYCTIIVFWAFLLIARVFLLFINRISLCLHAKLGTRACALFKRRRVQFIIQTFQLFSISLGNMHAMRYIIFWWDYHIDTILVHGTKTITFSNFNDDTAFCCWKL